jgi:hypothetical protein
VLHLRLDHDSQRRLLQVHELRHDLGLRLSTVRVRPGRPVAGGASTG